MSKRNPAVTLRQMIEFAGEIAALLEKRERADLNTNREFLRALERCVELIGEAATRLPDEFRKGHPEVPWRDAIAMRNVMIYGYDAVSADILWDTAARSIPLLRGQMETILRDLP